MAEIINGVPIGDLPGIESVPDDSMLVVEFLGKAYHMPGAVLRQMIQDVLDSMGDSVDDVTEARLTAAIETVLASGKYNGVSPSVEVLDEDDGTSVIHIIDAFGDKRYPVEVKGATDAVRYKPQSLTDAQKKQARENIDVSPGTITVKLSGSVTGGFDVVLNGESVTNEPLDRLAEEGYRVVGVAISEVKVLNYKVPAGTLFEYTNVFEFEDNSVVGSQNTRRFVFRVQVDDCNFTLRCTDGVWGGILQPIQATFFLKRNNGVPFIQYNGKTILPEDANWLSVQLILCEVQHRPVFCFQGDMQFFTDNNTAIQPPWGTAFSLRINDDNDYYFATEYDGYELQLLISPDGFVNSARKTSVYKAVESKADDLKAEDGTLFLLSAGEPIGEGVTLPTGSADDSKIFIADLNTSTYEDIKAADDAGKICYALWGGYTACMLTTLSPESAIFTTLLDPHLGLYVKFTKGTVGVSDFGLTESHSVLYEPQSLTDAQKAQARENIGALSADDIDVDSIGSNVYVSGLFSAKYADIKAAYEAGKACFITYGALLCTMTVFDAEKAEFVGMLTPHIGMKGTLYADGTYNFQYVHSNAVQTVEQSLTEEKKAQARANIGALSAGDVDTVLQQAKDSGQFDGEDGEDGYTPVKGVDYFDGKDGYTPVKGKDYFDGYTPVKGKDYFDGANGKTAYAYAQDGGYTGTEAEFAAKLASGSEPLKVTLSGNDTDGYTADKTVAEIYAARNAGRDIYMVGGVVTYQLSYLNSSFAAFSYTLASRNSIEIISVIMMSGVAPTRIHQTIDDSYVKYTAQSLDEEYKLQARTNIGAAAAADLSNYVTTGTAQTITGVKTFNAPANVAGTEQHTVKFKTSNGGAIIFGKEAANSGTMLRFDQVDGTTRLRFRGSDSAGAIVWEQPEQGAQLYIDLGAQGSDKHRITFPSSAGTLALTSGNVNTATIPLGFSSRKTNGNWGNTDGTTVTCWVDSTGGGIDFRRDNPSSGKLSIKLDGRVYVNEGLNPVMATEFANGFWGMTSPDGENNVWIRTTTQGIIPYQSGGAGAGHCNLGTSSWYFANAYIDKVYGSNFSGLAAKATADANGNNIASTYANKNVGNTFNGEQKMINSTHCPTMNDIASGVGCSLKNARACDNQLIVAEIFAPTTTVTDSKINMSAVAGEIGFYHGGSGSGGQFSGKTQLARITSAGIYEGSTLLSNKYLGIGGGTMTGPLTITGGDAATAGKIILNNTGKGQITDSGVATLFGFTSTSNLTVGHSNYNLVARGKATRPTYNGNNMALLSDVVEAAAPLRVNYDTATQTVDKTLSEIKAAWDAGRSVVLTDGTSVYPLNYVDTSEAVFSSFAINANSKFFFDSVHINSSGKVRYYSYSN